MKRLLVLLLLLAACAGPANETAAPSSDVAEPAPIGGPAPSRSPAPTGSAPVPAALDWSVDRIGGGQIDGGDLAGRDVVLWFWAPW